MGTTLSSIVSIAMAWKYSNAEHGLWKDSDFWFLVQVSIFQFCGFLVTGFTLSKEASKKNWVSIGFGLLCNIGGPITYCFAPRFCGVSLTSLAGIAQAFVVLWGAIADWVKKMLRSVEE